MAQRLRRNQTTVFAADSWTSTSVACVLAPYASRQAFLLSSFFFFFIFILKLKNENFRESIDYSDKVSLRRLRRRTPERLNPVESVLSSNFRCLRRSAGYRTSKFFLGAGCAPGGLNLLPLPANSGWKRRLSSHPPLMPTIRACCAGALRVSEAENAFGTGGWGLPVPTVKVPHFCPPPPPFLPLNFLKICFRRCVPDTD